MDVMKPPSEPISKIEFGQMMQKLENIEEHVMRTEKILMGNGSPGLTEKHAMLDERVRIMQASSDKIKGVVYGIMATIALSAGGLLWALLVHKATLIIP